MHSGDLGKEIFSSSGIFLGIEMKVVFIIFFLIV